MDQDEFRRTYRDVNAVYCAFEKSILTNECRCARAERFCIAEREGVRCSAKASQTRCLTWLELLREQTRFALRTEKERRLLPHGKAMRLQVGGMRGLLKVLDDITGDQPEIDDIDTTLRRAQQRFGGLDCVPFSTIMRDVSSYPIRKRARRR